MRNGVAQLHAWCVHLTMAPACIAMTPTSVSETKQQREQQQRQQQQQ